jgi:hypothetical protein
VAHLAEPALSVRLQRRIAGAPEIPGPLYLHPPAVRLPA